MSELQSISPNAVYVRISINKSTTITLTDDETAKLEIKIFTGKNTEKWLKKLNARSRSRTGVTMKKMVEKYENDIKSK